MSHFASDLAGEGDAAEWVDQQGKNLYDYAKKTKADLMGLADYDYFVERPDGDGSWGLWFPRVHPSMKNRLPPFIRTGPLRP